ncbi:unnamed protein product [Adineta ricciae]|uniref:CPAF-like PDZ domain-containing protein n=1 Tax=Adineta ricciae TaxID=249248 RepID=A0A814B9C4_ADIRI|nr:unnamed protein product [Adineta ricciae]CAF1077532.1 unnamed protein product [Adineta ricciae]
MKANASFLVIVICFTFSVASGIDSCTFTSTIADILPSNWSYSTLDKVKPCFQSILLNKTIVNQTIQQLFNSLDFYSFLSIARQSNAPYFINVNLDNELINIVNQSNVNAYQSDYDFHIAIVNSFKKLNDYHTQYTAPLGYANFILLLPFIFEFLPATQQIKIKQGVKLYSSLVGNDFNMNYTNEIITKIDGVNAFDYIKEFSERQSLISKDKNVKLNSVFKEEFWLRNLAKYPLPLRNNITFTFHNTTVTFPYVVLITKRFNNQLDLEKENSFLRPTPAFDQTRVLNYVNNFEKLDWYHERSTDRFNYIMGGNTTYLYTHKRTKTAIIKLGSFDEEHFPEIKKILLAASGDSLIIDLIGNHGGHSCMAYGLLNYLIPEYSNLGNLYEPMDGRITKTLQTWSRVFEFYPNSILNLQTGQSFTNMDWIQSYRNYTRGNITEEYSMKWSINCDGQVFGEGQYWLRNNTTPKYFRSIYALTDGTCGSACGLFLSKLKFGSNFKTIYGIGGGYGGNSLFESSSYAGGGAFNWNDIVMYYNLVNSNSSSPPRNFPTSAFLNLNVYEIYINKLNPDCPREYASQPIDKHITGPDYFNLEHALEQIIDNNISSFGINMQIDVLFILNLLALIIFSNYIY